MSGLLPQAEFDAIYSRVPRLTVEAILLDDRGVFLTRRASGPCAGRWHIPGGTVRFGEPLEEAVSRVALAETGVTVIASKQVRAVEYPSHYLKGLDHPVGIAFIVSTLGDPRAAAGADMGGWFDGGDLPAGMHDEQVDLIQSVW